MKDPKACQISPHDGTLRIHHRRAGIYQPKDSIGLSCIMQVNNCETNQSLIRRKTLTIPQDNIGISCLPATDFNCILNKSKDTESNICNDISHNLQEDNLKKAEVQENYDSKTTLTLGNRKQKNNSDISLRREDTEKHINTKKIESNKKKDINATKETMTIGISNIRRPKTNGNNPRKPIFPKDNIQFCCRLLHKPTNSKTSLGSIGKINSNGSEKNQSTKKTRPAAIKSKVKSRIMLDNVKKEYRK